MALKIRRGPNSDRLAFTPAQGELIFTTDTKLVYVGDGSTVGGIGVGGGSVSVVTDNAPSLGGNLNLNGHNVTGNGNISITGNVQVSHTNVLQVGATTISEGSVTSTQILPAGGIGTLYVASNLSPPLSLVGVTDGAYNACRLEILGSKGTITAPTNTNAGDNVSAVYFKGYNSAGSSANSYFCFAGAVGASWQASANFTTTNPASVVGIYAGNNSSVPAVATFDGLKGTFTAPLLQTTVYSVAGTPLPSASTVGVGARAFVSDATSTTFASAYTGGGSNKVPVYSDGSAWHIG